MQPHILSNFANAVARALQPLPLRPGALSHSPPGKGRKPKLPSQRDQPVQQSNWRKNSGKAAAAAAAMASAAADGGDAGGAAEPSTPTGGGRGRGSGRGGGRGRGRKRKGQEEVEQPATPGSGAADNEDVGLLRSASSRRRRGDEEFEQQLAMAVGPAFACSGSLVDAVGLDC